MNRNSVIILLKGLQEYPCHEADQKTLDGLKEKIKADPRVAVSRKHMMQTILKQTGFKRNIPAGNRFWDYTDSVLAE